MAFFDVFNGDADGICALQQLRLAEPRQSTLVTGVKRDIALLKQVEPTAGDELTVLDISLDKNRDALIRALEAGAKVMYCDHHYAGDIPSHTNLAAHIDTSSDTCTSLIVNKLLDGAHRGWAVVGAYGDNFDESAAQAAEPMGLNVQALAQLRELGICINYNGYGATQEDLHFRPAELFRKIQPHADPLTFINEDETLGQLRDGYYGDLERVRAVKPELETDKHGVYVLPAEKWARRVSGVFANELAQTAPERAHAMLTRLPDGGFLVSVRAPLATKEGADDLCRHRYQHRRAAVTKLQPARRKMLHQFNESGTTK